MRFIPILKYSRFSKKSVFCFQNNFISLKLMSTKNYYKNNHYSESDFFRYFINIFQIFKIFDKGLVY